MIVKELFVLGQCVICLYIIRVSEGGKWN